MQILGWYTPRSLLESCRYMGDGGKNESIATVLSSTKISVKMLSYGQLSVKGFFLKVIREGVLCCLCILADGSKYSFFCMEHDC